jgi:thioredoxin-like negative regulator of GroEL
MTTSSPRLPGQSITGSLSLGRAQRASRQLVQARTLVAGGHAVEALKLYTKILKSQPHNASALAESGWLEYEAGSEAGNAALMRTGEANVEEAVHSNPGASEAHLLLAYLLVNKGETAQAAAQLRLFLADHPSRQLVSAEHSTIIEVFRAVGQQPPAS